MKLKSLFFLCAIFIAEICASQTYSRVKLHIGPNGLNGLANAGVAVDHLFQSSESVYTGYFSEFELEIIESFGIRHDIVVEDIQAAWAERNASNRSSVNISCSDDAELIEPENFEIDESYAGFYRYNDMLAALDLMQSLYPEIITVKAPISNFETFEGRPIYHVIISDNPSQEEAEEPNVLYTAIHHAREPMSMSQTIFYMWYLLENYDSDPEVQFLVDNTRMFFVPCINPDGYVLNETQNPNGFGLHRKNVNPVNASNPGVDLNRNYGYQWGTTGISFNTESDVYPGTGPFSEPESQAMRWLVYNHDMSFAFNSHSFGNLILHPIGTTFDEFADHHDYYTQFTNFMVRCNHYQNMKSSGLSLASGDSDDYEYREDIGVQMKDTVFSMTPEVGTSFWPSIDNVLTDCNNMLIPNLMLAHLPHNYYGVEEVNGDIILADAQGDIFINAQRLGRTEGNVIVSLEPINGISFNTGEQMVELNLMESSELSFSYDIVAAELQNDENIEFEIVSNYGTWVDRQLVTKIGSFPTLLISDNADNNDNWQGDWELSSSEFVSPSSSFTDSEFGDYSNNETSVYEMIEPIDLSIATSAAIRFNAKWEIESGYDYCQFQVSTNDGGSWSAICGIFTTIGEGEPGSIQPESEPLWDGFQEDWVQEYFNLNDYLGEVIKVRFVLRSDGFVNQDGFFFDDFQVGVSPQLDTSVPELNESIVDIYPNPASTYVQINTDMNQGFEAFLFSVDGKLIKTQSFNTNNDVLDISDIAKGVYQLRIKSGDIVEEKRLVIER